jgi:hypothetical protein
MGDQELFHVEVVLMLKLDCVDVEMRVLVLLLVEVVILDGIVDVLLN